MATVFATCADCGDVTVAGPDVTVRVCRADGQASCALRCPKCRMVIARPVSEVDAVRLVTAGARQSVWDPPAELAERHQGGPVTHDDLIDFHRALGDAGAFAAAVEALR